MTTTWNCLVGMGPGEPDLGHEVGAVHNDRYSFLISAQPDKTYWFVFMRVDKPYSTYKRPRYTEKDAEAAAASMAEHPISGTKVFGELWKNRWRGVLVDIEEGVLDHWHFGRSVLVGDAAHKVLDLEIRCRAMANVVIRLLQISHLEGILVWKASRFLRICSIERSELILRPIHLRILLKLFFRNTKRSRSHAHGRL